MVSFANSERVALCQTFLAVGPDSPTLCEGWTTRDLAAHLVLRETRPDASLGMFVSRLAGRTERVQDSIAATPWTRLVAQVQYPSRWSPLSRGPLAETANRTEFFVHHEDVLRAQPSWDGVPRTLSSDHAEALWSDVQRLSRLLLRGAPVGVRISRNDTDDSIVPRTPRAPASDPAVELIGTPGELIMFIYGRDDHADVSTEGDPADIASLRATL